MNKDTKFNLVWTDDIPNVKWEENINWRYLIGYDPYYKPNWWQKILMFFGIGKKDKSITSIFIIDVDGTWENIPKEWIEEKNILERNKLELMERAFNAAREKDMDNGNFISGRYPR